MAQSLFDFDTATLLAMLDPHLVFEYARSPLVTKAIFRLPGPIAGHALLRRGTGRAAFHPLGTHRHSYIHILYKSVLQTYQTSILLACAVRQLKLFDLALRQYTYPSGRPW